MASLSMHTGDITLHGVPDGEDGKPGSSLAVLLRLSDGLLRDIKKASHAKEGLQFVTGSTPVRLPYSLSVGLTAAKCGVEASDRRQINRPESLV